MDEIRTYEEVLLQVEKEEELESEVEHTLQMFARKVMQSRMVGGKALRDHFRNYDRNKDNTIDRDEFGQMMRTLGLNLNDRELDEFFAEMDILSNARHDHIVRFLGGCVQPDNL